MQVLGSYALEKYQTEKFEPIIYDIYHNKGEDNYCFCFEITEEADQYPLEDLLTQYSLNCTDLYGQGSQVNGAWKYLVEVETLSTDKADFISILNFSTILNKEIVNYVKGKYECLAEKRCMSSFYMGNQKVEVPVLAYRSDNSGMVSFQNKYPEWQLTNLFLEDKKYDIECLDGEWTCIELLNGKANLILNNSQDEYFQYIFDLKGFQGVSPVLD